MEHSVGYSQQRWENSLKKKSVNQNTVLKKKLNIKKLRARKKDSSREETYTVMFSALFVFAPQDEVIFREGHLL